MSLHADHKALVFIGAIAVLGAGVRVLRAAGSSPPPGNQPALDHQMQAADSAARAGKAAGRGRSRRTPNAAHRLSSTPADSGRSSARMAAPAARAGWVNGKLDLDVATATQIDSLPGVSPTIARRIVADRMQRGPFISLARLRRVSGVGPKLLQSLDSLVVFSGTVLQPNAADSVIQHVKKPPRRSSAGKAP